MKAFSLLLCAGEGGYVQPFIEERLREAQFLPLRQK